MDSAGEENWVLKNDADAISPCFRLEGTDVWSTISFGVTCGYSRRTRVVEGYLSLIGVIEPTYELLYRALPTSARPATLCRLRLFISPEPLTRVLH